MMAPDPNWFWEFKENAVDTKSKLICLIRCVDKQCFLVSTEKRRVERFIIHDGC